MSNSFGNTGGVQQIPLSDIVDVKRGILDPLFQNAPSNPWFFGGPWLKGRLGYHNQGFASITYLSLNEGTISMPVSHFECATKAIQEHALLKRLLPKLKILHIYASTVEFLSATLPWIMAFSGITLWFDSSIPVNHIGYFFSLLCENYIGHISDLTVHSHASRTWRDWPTHNHVELLNRLTGLARFSTSLNLLSPELLGALSLHPKLQTLQIFADGLAHTRFSQVPGGFLNLKRLDLNRVPADNVIELVKAIANPIEVSITLTHVSYPTQIRFLCSEIVKYCPRVTKFTLRVLQAAVGDVLHVSDFAPLSTLRLEVLRLFHPNAMPFLDGDIKNILMQWPGLKTLVLNPYPQEQGANSRHCPTLRSLYDYVKRSGLDFFGAYFGPDALVPRSRGTGRGNTTLRVLDLGRTGGNNTGNEQDVMRYLHGLFPSVRLDVKLDEDVECSLWVNQVANPDSGTSFGAFSVVS